MPIKISTSKYFANFSEQEITKFENNTRITEVAF